MLKTIAEVSQLIRSGQKLLLAGGEQQLGLLPCGDWIAGTIPYFMTKEGGQANSESIFVTVLPVEVQSVQVVTYSVDTLPRIAVEAPEHGFTILILPANSAVHLDYAREAPDYPQMFLKPIVGWISGVLLADLGTVSPKVVDGRTGQIHDHFGVAMHCSLVPGMRANIGILNLFRQGDGDTITFPLDGFQVTDCQVNGAPASFARYLAGRGIDTKLPLVANYSGAMINVSIQNIDQVSGQVNLVAPVFEGVTYRFAAPIGDYVLEFQKALPSGIAPVFTCNCILNYFYSELKGKVIPGMSGPFTFGEIAYQLLNQTLVYLTLEKE